MYPLSQLHTTAFNIGKSNKSLNYYNAIKIYADANYIIIQVWPNNNKKMPLEKVTFHPLKDN